MSSTTTTTAPPAPAAITCAECGKPLRNGKGHAPTCVHAAPPPGDAKQQARAARQARATKPAAQRSAAAPKPKPATPAQADQGAPAPKPAPKQPKQPKRTVHAYVLPQRGKTAITEGKLPANAVLIESVRTPWQPGAVRILLAPEGTALPKPDATTKLINLSHVKGGADLADWKIVPVGDCKAAQVWLVQPAPAAPAAS